TSASAAAEALVVYVEAERLSQAFLAKVRAYQARAVLQLAERCRKPAQATGPARGFRAVSKRHHRVPRERFDARELGRSEVLAVLAGVVADHTDLAAGVAAILGRAVEQGELRIEIETQEVADPRQFGLGSGDQSLVRELDAPRRIACAYPVRTHHVFIPSMRRPGDILSPCPAQRDHDVANVSPDVHDASLGELAQQRFDVPDVSGGLVAPDDARTGRR